MSNITRRQWLTSCTGIGLTASLSGCVGGADSADIELEYELTDQRPWGEFSDELSDQLFGRTYSPSAEEESWIWGIIEFTLVRGSFDAADLFLTYVEVRPERDPRWFYPRVIRITSPELNVLSNPDDSYSMEAGTKGELYHLFQVEVDNHEWDISRLDEKHGGVRAREQ